MNKDKPKGGKQSIKRQRIKNYFLEAAKVIIINEGVENVSVRKVADIAGYSYATIYNYFIDLNELLWDAREAMIIDLVDFMQGEMHQPSYDADGIKRLFKTYIAYYFENPNIFKFFYLHPLSKPEKTAGDTEDQPDFGRMWEDTFKGFVLEGVLDARDIEVVAKTFIYAMHGMLTLSFSYGDDLTKDKVFEDLGKMVDYILRIQK